MRVIPVIDLMNGHVVRGVAGRRSEYRLIQSQLVADAWPATTARVLADKFGFQTVYVADLDAIMHGQRNERAWELISESGLQLWLDAGVGSISDAKVVLPALKRLATDSTIVVGLESLASSDFQDLVPFVGSAHLVFSLDLRGGEPMTSIDKWKSAPPIEIARCVLKAGVQRLIVLDLVDVGVGDGPRTLPLCRQIRHEFPAIELVAGGGVRGMDDLRALADAGCDAALVASALHDGRLTKNEIDEITAL